MKPARVEVGLEQRPVAPIQLLRRLRLSVPNRANLMFFTVLGDFGALRCNVFLTFYYPSRAKRSVLDPFSPPATI